MTQQTNNADATALVIAFQKRDDQDADWRKKIAPTVEALEKSAADGGFNWDGKVFTSIKKWVPVALNITYRAWRYRVTGGNQKRGTKKKKGETSVSPAATFRAAAVLLIKVWSAGVTTSTELETEVREMVEKLETTTRLGQRSEKQAAAGVQPKKKKSKRLTLRQTHSALRTINKQVGTDRGGTIDEQIERAQKRYEAIVALGDAERKPHYSAYRTAKRNAEERLTTLIKWKETEAQMAKITHLQVADEPEFSHCARRNMKLTTDINAVECEECRQRYEQQKEIDERKPVHAAGNTINPDNPRRVRCSNGGSRPKITDDKKEVTCPNCLRGLDQDEQLSWYLDFEKTVPEGATKNQKDDLWRVYLRARRGSIYDPENVTEAPCEDPAKAMDWYRKYVVVVCPSSKEEAQ